ncbi:phosphodiester glycosidase family protein [Ancrocorticia populi]|uniref:phosphodiester glycosidase family protein n=1 Tax=Ancrocorticia populi TaxID=2175228 RepID=UPI003F977640
MNKNKKVRRAVIGSSLAVSLAVAGVGGWALDRFVIDHVQIASASEYEAEQGSTVTEYASDGTATVTDSTYEGENASITVEQQTAGSGEDTVTYYVATVDLTDATALRSAFANDQFGQSITDTTSNIAEDNDAVFAINGDYYGFRDTGIVIRNGVVYRDEGAREGLAFYEDGTVELYDETATTADELVEDGVWNTLSFGPAIVENGSVIDGIDDIEIDTNFGNHSIQGEQPRTLVGVKSDGTLVFVVVDGRDDGYSRGVTMTEAAELMVSLGCETAYNLDGGGSSTMYFNGEVVNQPSNGSERGTSDILYIEDLS